MPCFKSDKQLVDYIFSSFNDAYNDVACIHVVKTPYIFTLLSAVNQLVEH